MFNVKLVERCRVKTCTTKYVEAKEKKLFWLEAIFLCQNLRRCFMGGGSYFMGESQNFKYISCPITS